MPLLRVGHGFEQCSTKVVYKSNDLYININKKMMKRVNDNVIYKIL